MEIQWSENIFLQKSHSNLKKL